MRDIPSVRIFLFGGLFEGGHYEGFYDFKRGEPAFENYCGTFEGFKELVGILLGDWGIHKETLENVELPSKEAYKYDMPSVKDLKEYYKRYILEPIGEFKSKKEAEDYMVDWLQDGLSPEYPVNPNSKKFRKYLWEEGYLVKFGGSFIVTLKDDYSYDILDGFETV